MSNLPEGVTGAEDSITGGEERDVVLDVECDECGSLVRLEVHEVIVGRIEIRSEWTCPECGTEHTNYRDIADDLDPDIQQED